MNNRRRLIRKIMLKELKKRDDVRILSSSKTGLVVISGTSGFTYYDGKNGFAFSCK